MIPRLDLTVLRIVAAKELREAIRDRRTLFVALVLPVLIYPIVILGFAPLVGRQKAQLAETSQAIAVSGPDAAAFERIVLAPEGVPPESRPQLSPVRSADPAADLAARKVSLWIEVPEGFDEAVAAEGSGRVVVRYDGSDDQSLEARRKAGEALAAASDRAFRGRMERRALPEAWLHPISREEVDTAPPDRSAAHFYGRILALLLVLMTLTSSFYPAVDAVAGEKERGTMETLMVAPCGRTEIVLGKFLAVCTVTLAAALLNLASLAFSTGPGLAAVAGGKMPQLTMSLGVVGGILALLVPLAALFSAVALSLSTLARSIKEAQHYLSPLVMLTMPLAMAVTLPNLPLTPTLAAVPVTNAVLFFRDLMLDRTEWVTTTIVLVTTFGSAALAIWASVLLFLREETLFRGSEDTGGLLARPRPRPVPGGASAVFLFVAALALVWYLDTLLPKEFDRRLVAQQLGLVLGPCVLLAWWLRVRPGATFRIGGSGRTPVHLLLGAALGFGLPVVVSALYRAIFGSPDEHASGSFAELNRRVEEFVRAIPSWRVALLFGVLPAVCEELFFRGFLLSGFRSSFTGRTAVLRAIAASSLCFALFHIFPERWFGTFVVGSVLAWVTVRTGSLWPAVVAHAVNNASALLIWKAGEDGPFRAWIDGRHEDHGKAVAAAAGLVVASLLLLHRTSAESGPRSGADGDREEDPGPTAGGPGSPGGPARGT